VEKDVQKLLNFMSEFDALEEGKFLFEALDKFFCGELKTKKVVVFSIPRHMKKKPEADVIKTCRFLWNKKQIGKLYPRSRISQMLEEIKKSPDSFRSWHHRKYDEENVNFIYLGQNQWQVFYAYYELGKRGPISDECLNYATKFIHTTYQRILKWREVSKYKSLVHIDDITGLFNQRKLLKDLEYCMNRYGELKEQFFVYFIDVDHFKQVNDGHGHLVGTQLLAEIAKLLKNILRVTDYVYRYGGDEYVAIVTDIDYHNAMVVGERMLKSIKEHVFTVDDMGVEKKITLSVSIGIAGFPVDAKTQKEILSLADRMMYEAKEGGRGQVRHAERFFKEEKIAK
jgi:diguanylate cyclase (GGDEF)-like protein